METFYIKEERLNNGNSRYYPIMRVQGDNDSYYNETFLLEVWPSDEGCEYSYSYDSAVEVIKKQKEHLLNTNPEVTDTLIHNF